MNRVALIVEDEALIALALEDMLVDLGFSVCGIAASAADALRLARQHAPNLVLMDVRLKGADDGVTAARAMSAHGLSPCVIFLTGSREPATVARVRADQPAGLLFKPVRPEDLAAAIDAVCP